MAFEMPPEPEIDTSRAGALSISFEVLHGIMRFPPTVRIASVDIDGPLGSIVLRLEGEPMPLVARQRSWSPFISKVTLIVSVPAVTPE